MSYIPPHLPIDLRPAVVRRELAYGRHYAAVHGGLLPHDRWWNTMVAREDQSLAMGFHKNFAKHHPYAIGLLDNDYFARNRPPVIPPSEPPSMPFPPSTPDKCRQDPPPFRTISSPPSLPMSLTGSLVILSTFLVRKISGF